MEEEKAEKFWKEEKARKRKVRKKPREIKELKRPRKITIEGEKVRDGLAQLILTVIELLRELMEKQAIRRIEHGSLTEEQIENLGNTFMALKQEVEKLKEYFEFEDDELNIDLGPLTVGEEEGGKASVVEILDRLLGKGVVVRGDVVISVAEVDLIALNLGLLLASMDKARELYGSGAARTGQLEEEVRKLREENLRLKNAKDKI